VVRKVFLAGLIMALWLSILGVSPALATGNTLDYEKSRIDATEQQENDTDSFWDFLPFDLGDGLSNLLDDVDKFFDPVINALKDAVDWVSDGINDIGDWWDSLSDWTKDLIFTVIVVIAVIAVAVAAFFLLPFVGVALLIGAIIGAIAAGVFYFLKYGGTDAFGWSIIAWVSGGAVLGALGGWLYSIGAFGTLAGLLRTGLSRGLAAVMNGMRTFGGWLGQGLRTGARYLANGLRTFAGWLGQGLRTATRYVTSGLRSFARWLGQGLRTGWRFVSRTGARFGRWTVRSGRTMFGAIGRFYGGWGAFGKSVGIGAAVSFVWDVGSTVLTGGEFDVLEIGRNMAINGLTAGIGGPIPGKLLSAITSKGWGSLAGWSALSAGIGSASYGISEYFGGSFTTEDLIVGGIGGIIALPGTASIANALGDFAEPITQPMGNYINSFTADLYYWNDPKAHPDNGLKSLYNKGLEKFSEFQQSIINLYRRP
jgi:hypothetical protein